MNTFAEGLASFTLLGFIIGAPVTAVVYRNKQIDNECKIPTPKNCS